jgi:hypothetical protein
VKRRLASCCALLALALASPALGASSPAVANGAATGTVTALSGSSFTIQTAGPRVGVVNAMTRAAIGITNHSYPYVWAGGHAQAGIASTGTKGRHKGFDCSGSVAAVLAGAGIWPAGSGVPNDAGIIGTLRRQGLIAPGVGTGPVEVTLYDHPGVHIFMNIDGRFFGTSDGAGGGNPHGGAGWLDDGAPDAASRAYRAYHFLPSVLHSSTNAGHIVSFQLGALSTPPVIELGDRVQVNYAESRAGSLFATSIAYPGSTTTTGTVSSIAADGSSFTLQTSAGQTLTLALPNPDIAQGLGVGDTVQVVYTTSGGTSTARVVTVTATAPAPPGGDSTGSSGPTGNGVDNGGYQGGGYPGDGSPGGGY